MTSAKRNEHDVEFQPFAGGLPGAVVYRVCRSLVWLYAKLYHRLEVSGRENYPRGEPFLLACNHASFLDPPFVGVTVPQRMAYLAKEELFRIPLFGLLLRAVGAFPIRRNIADLTALRRCREVLRAGHPLIVFPEGTRTTDGQMKEARPGVGMLAAQNAELPIVPVHIEGTFAAWGPGKLLPRPSKVRIRVGKPFRILVPESGESVKKQLYREIGTKILAHIANVDPSGQRLKEADSMETDGKPVTFIETKESPDDGAGNRTP